MIMKLDLIPIQDDHEIGLNEAAVGQSVGSSVVSQNSIAEARQPCNCANPKGAILALTDAFWFSHLGFAQQRLMVRVDPRIELVSVLETLAPRGYEWLVSFDDTAYRRDVLSWFSGYKSHPAVLRAGRQWLRSRRADGNGTCASPPLLS
jgi:hypothetical protein